MAEAAIRNLNDQPTHERDDTDLWRRLLYFMNPFDGRYDDLVKGNWKLNALRDAAAGLIVAMVAIPLAMGFAMASGLRPEQGIVGGAVAGLVGALFGGSKYQVYGPTAAFIPVIAGIMATYNLGILILASMIAGVILMLMGVARLGRLSRLVPHSIVVGFTMGIAVVIALSQIGEVLGLKASLGYGFFDKVAGVIANVGDVNWYAVGLGLLTFVVTKYLLKVSPFIPAPLIALAAATGLSATVFAGKGLTLIKDKYGAIPTDFFVFNTPAAIPVDAKMLLDLSYFVAAIIFVSAVESLLCSRMADRLAENKGAPFNPNKELWGQGVVQILVPLFNGFPHTGALARTATNIKVGAISPLAGIFKAVLKLLLAAFLAKYLELVPMASIGGILLYLSTAMVKPAEVKEALAMSKFHIGLMFFTAAMVVVTDFLTGVMTAITIYAVGYWIGKRVEARNEKKAAEPAYSPTGD